MLRQRRHIFALPTTVTVLILFIHRPPALFHFALYIRCDGVCMVMYIVALSCGCVYAVRAFSSMTSSALELVCVLGE